MRIGCSTVARSGNRRVITERAQGLITHYPRPLYGIAKRVEIEARSGSPRALRAEMTQRLRHFCLRLRKAHAFVSILTRPWGRVQRAERALALHELGVSILTRPWGRVQPISTAYPIRKRCIPAKLGCYSARINQSNPSL